jgi:hypothetical protein
MTKFLFEESRNLKNTNLGLKDEKFKICFNTVHARLCFVPTVIQMTRHLSFDHWLVEREPMFILLHGRMGHMTFPLTVRG